MSDISAQAAPPAKRRRSTLPLWGVLLVCGAPVLLAAYLYFFNVVPVGVTNYGDLVEPQRDVPPPHALVLQDLEGQAFDLQDLYGKWLMISADSGDCRDACATKHFIKRQTHASTGKQINRIVRVWLILDDEPVPTLVIRAYEGMLMLRANRQQVQDFLALPAGAPASDLNQHIWVVDPRGHLMMRFPADPDPSKLRKDIGRLLHNSRIG